MQWNHPERGTTLLEAVIAIGLLAGAVASLAGLSSMAIRTNTLARERTLATVYSLQKLEELCRDARRLSTSPGNALESDTPGFIDYLDRHGAVVGATAGVVFVRRWSVIALPADANLLAIQVESAPCRKTPGASRCGDTTADSRLASIRSRLAW
jgi:type II secretory pathway pseudopilin PulG